MNRYLVLVCCFCFGLSWTQTFDDELKDIIASESKVASSRFYERFSATMNTGNYDVKYHKLEFTLNPAVASISGVVTTHFEAKELMTEITFDLASNMTVSQVLQNGASLAFSQNSNDELIITLQQAVAEGNIGIVEITYSGNPVSSGFGSFAQTSHNGDPIIWTLSEPYGAKGWWPCKQDLNDKIETIDVYITTPQFNPDNEEYIAVSNGVEQSQTVTGTTKTTHFKHEYPIPAYLIAVAVTNYAVYSHTVPNNGNPFDIVNYVYPENLSTAQASTAVTVPIMNLYSNLFEEYPFVDHLVISAGSGVTSSGVVKQFNPGTNLFSNSNRQAHVITVSNVSTIEKKFAEYGMADSSIHVHKTLIVGILFFNAI